MSIRESRPNPPADVGARWAAARDFVERCRSWSVDELGRRAMDGRPTADWQVYLRFTEHTLAELDAGTLDPWFEASPG